jgi:glycosyltransferase involved in cell wall biosynthesis
MSPLISVIVPIYNAEKYITRCVNSIWDQTYSLIEILLIDDGSLDSSSSICDELAIRDTRIKVVHKPNGGVTSARVAGIENSKGEFLCFVDADDVLLPTALHEMVSCISNDVDIVIPDLSLNETISIESYVKGLIDNRIPWGVVGKLFRKQCFVRNSKLVPKEFNIGEDLLMQLIIASELKRNVSISNTHAYSIIGCPNSATQVRHWSVEYELRFVAEVEKLARAFPFDLRENLFHLRMRSLKGMVCHRVDIDYKDQWFVQLVKDSSLYTTSMEERILLNVKNSSVSRLLLAIKEWLWKILH